MGGKGVPRSHSKGRPCPGRKTLKRCKNNGPTDNVVFIDVDSEGFDNVIIIDVPESLPNRFFGSSSLRKDKNSPFVICIDDEESTDDNYRGIGIKGDENVDIDPSSSARPCPASTSMRDSVDPAVDECQFVQEKMFPVKLSKCKRTYSGKASTRNHYGFSAELDGSSSDNESPDCEFMEGSFGSIKEQWEKAFSKKKFDIRIGRSGLADHANASGSCNNNNGNLRADNMAERHPESPVFSGPMNASFEKEDQSTFVAKGDETMGTIPKSFQGAPDDYLSEKHYTNARADAGGRPDSMSDVMFQSELFSSLSKGSDTVGDAVGEAHFSCNFTARKNQCFGSSSDNLDDQQLQGMSSSFKHEDTKEANQLDVDGTPPEEPCLSRPVSPVSSANKNFCYRKTNFPVMEAKHGCNLQEESVDGESLFQKSHLSDEIQANHYGYSTNDKVEAASEETFSQRSLSMGNSTRNEKNCHDEKLETIAEASFFSSPGHDEAQQEQEKSAVGEEELPQSASNSQQEIQRYNLDASGSVNMLQNIINDREKLKETDEYKRALEEELASRQQALQIQAEEAQRLRQLRKRRKAEIMRLLDMERRQKQRVEEVRESLKKDEENMNQKELFRIEVRKELAKLELMCHDMASLLSGLGISVSGSPYSSPHEVRIAYKRALLTFHPDRASRSDIREQVEAEEKFKLISHMKEKFLPT